MRGGYESRTSVLQESALRGSDRRHSGTRPHHARQVSNLVIYSRQYVAISTGYRHAPLAQMDKPQVFKACDRGHSYAWVTEESGSFANGPLGRTREICYQTE